MNIEFLKDIKKNDAKIAGGKGASLDERLVFIFLFSRIDKESKI